MDRLGLSPWRRLTVAQTPLRRDLRALQVYFRKYGLSYDVEDLVSPLIEELDVFGVLG